MIWTNDSTLASMKLTDKEFTPILYDVKIHNIKNPSNQKNNINQEMKKNQQNHLFDYEGVKNMNECN